MNGDGQNPNDLIFVPRSITDPNEIILIDDTDRGGNVIYTADTQARNPEAYISQDPYLSQRRGQYAERNGMESPWVNKIDLRILQDFFVNIKGKRNTLQVSFDVFNLGNLINRQWGIVKITNRTSLLTFEGYNAEGRPTYTFPYLTESSRTPLTSTFRDDTSITSRWQMQFGAR